MIGSAGELFEGRGFLREGQTSNDSLTSYNKKAVSVGFIMRENEKIPSDRQRKAFCQFVAKSISENDLEERQTALDVIFSQYNDELANTESRFGQEPITVTSVSDDNACV